MRVAQVIVDVKTMQTDKPYLYLVPNKWEEIAQIGMRVAVPFGRSNRKIQGFIVGFSEEENVENLKEILDFEDLSPVLNDELLNLADYMKDETFAFKIKCLQTMLPAALKTKYQKWVVPKSELGYEILPTPKVYEDTLKILSITKLAKLLQKADVELIYQRKQKINIKTKTAIKRLISIEEITNLSESIRNAPKQVLILEVLKSLKDDELKFVEELKPLGIELSHLKTAEKKGWLKLSKKEIYRNINQNFKIESKNVILNDEQQAAVDEVSDEIGKSAKTFLLKGITGSGKTEVYLRLIEEAMNKNLRALMLVPEITLTPQMVAQLTNKFGKLVAVLHSGLSQGERYDEWRKIKRGEAKVVVGARSAIFAPLTNLGIIIIDEEHESSYKQEEMPRYHARDIAKWRSDYHNCPLVLGSATPSLESMARALKGNYKLLELKKRANPKAMLPAVNLIDLTKEFTIKPMISTKLKEAIDIRLTKNEQSVLLLNKRGFASFMLCEDCGYVLECPNCSVSLTMHKVEHVMKCHYCGHKEKIPNVCPICQSNKLQFYGAGTQKIESYLQELWPTAKIIRMDVDTTTKKGKHEQLLEQFQKQEADILLGTQMIAKGLDFPNVTLVGVLNADTALNLPDFRASERTFQLLTQVGGRAGRSDKPGEVIIQTYNPKHYAIQYAKTQDYDDFFRYEMQVRHLGNYSPYYYTIQLVISHQKDLLAAHQSQVILKKLQPYLKRDIIVLGPNKTTIEKIKNMYNYQIIIKYKNDPELLKYLKELILETQFLAREGYQIRVDKDPNHFI